MKKITLLILFLSSLWGYSQASCSDATSIYEDFDTYSYNATTQVLPDCWAKTGTTGLVYIINNSAAPMSPSNKLSMVADPSGTAPTVAYAVMPPLSNLQAGNYRLKFFCTAGLITNKALEVGYFAESGNANSYVSLQAVNLTVTSSRQYTVVPGALPPGVKNLVFKHNGLDAYSTTLFIDDVIWEPINTCSNVSGIQVKQITMNSVKLSWEPGGSETSWQYVCLPSNILNPNTQTPIDATTAFITVNGLSPSTRYKIWVRSKCSDTDFGSWINSTGFTTLCSPVSQFMENFDAAAKLPGCWAQVGTGYLTIDSSTSSPAPSQPYYMSMNSAISTMVSLPTVSNAGDGTNRLRFKVRTNTAGAKLDVGYLTDPANASTFVVLQTVTCNSTTSFEDKVLGLGADPKSSYLAFRNSESPSKIIYIDDVIWEPIPTCPDISNLAATSVKGASVDLAWTEGGSENTWQYAIGDASLKDPFSLTPMNVSSSKPTVSGLNPLTSYKIWVRSKCDGASIGAWMGPVSFTTSCASVTYFSQNFDDSTSMPTCWNKIGSTGTVTVSTIINGASAPNALGLTSNSATSQAVCAMPPVSNANSGTYRLKFKHKASELGAVLELGYLANFTDPKSFVPLQSFSATKTTFDSESIELGMDPATDMLAFRNPGPTYCTIYIDDVIWEPIPACTDVTNVVSTGATDTSIKLSWVAGDSETKWQYVIGSSSITDPNTLTPVDVTATSAVTITGLTPATSYKIWVRSKCSAINLGAWVGPLAIATTCSGVTEFVQNFDASTTLPSCWNKLGAGISGHVSTLSDAPAQSNMLFLYGSTNVPQPVVVSMPPISNKTATDHVLKFKCRSSVPGSALQFGFLTNPSDATSFVPFKDITVASTTEFQTTIISLGPYASSNIMAFRHTGSVSGYIYVDDVSWDFAPIAAPLCATGISATPHPSCGNFATTISWSAVPSADGYKLSVGTTPGGSDVLDNQIVGALSYSVASATNKTYYYTVTPYNGGGDAGHCVEQTYVTNPKGCYCPSVPNFVDGVGVTNVLFGTTSFAGNKSTYYDFTSNTVNLVKGKNANLQITYDLAGHPYNIASYIDFNDNYIFESSEIVFTGVSALVPPSTVDASFMMPATASLGNHRMRITSIDKNNMPDPCLNNLSFMVVLDFNLNVVANESLGADSFNGIDFSYYPNPVKDMLNLSFDQEMTNVSVVNLLGQQIISTSLNANQGKIDMSGLSVGTYLVRVNSGDQLKTIKVMKE